MAAHAPILASENSAAKMLDMKLAEFRSLVEAGLLPRGREIAPGFRRWAVDELRLIATGHACDGMDDIKW